MKVTRILPSLALLALSSSLALAATPMGTVFTYQGRLTSGTNAANGIYDFQFSAWDAASGGLQQGPLLSTNAVGVSNGLFLVRLDFGNIFDGNARWLAIAVKTNGGATYTNLTPRQPLTPAPQAVYASSAGTASVANGVANNAVTAVGIASGQVVKSLNGLRDSVTLAAGANLTLTPSGQTLTLATPTDWHVTGNVGTTPGTHFLGTTDYQPLELRVNGQRALRLEPGTSPNVIGGYSGNFVRPGTAGVTIGGGGTGSSSNSISASFSVIAGGYGNTIQLNASNSTVGGGEWNEIQPGAYGSTIGGGEWNEIQTNAYRSTISGGDVNAIQTGAYRSAIGGGHFNKIETNAWGSTVGGGVWNSIQAGAYGSTIGGGGFNTNQPEAQYATIPGGGNNVVAGDYAFAAGFRAKALHQGCFVWADSVNADQSTWTSNQFMVRASGGVRFFTNPGSTTGSYLNPSGSEWLVVSDRNAKKNFHPVDGREILAKLATVPITRWNYKSEPDDAVTHIGPTAQDFKGAFYPGSDATGIGTLEFDGVALAAIQGLNQKLEEQNAALQREVAELKALVRTLAEKVNGGAQ